MFIQVIEGRTERPDELHERLDIWQRDLMPGRSGISARPAVARRRAIAS